jgi:hypothetical protein
MMLPLYAATAEALGIRPDRPVEDPDVVLARTVHEFVSTVNRLTAAGLPATLDRDRARALLADATDACERLRKAVAA